MINSEKNCVARRIDVAARTVGVMMGIWGYATIFTVMAFFGVRFAAVNPSFIFYLLPVLFFCIMGMGAGMGFAYIRSLLVLPDWMAWFWIVWDNLFPSLFYLGWVAIPISLIFGPASVIFSCCLFFSGLGYRLFASMRVKNIRLFSRKTVCGILLVCLCLGAVAGVIFYDKVNTARYDIAKMASNDKNTVNAEDVVFDEIWFSFLEEAKGIIVVYNMQSGDYSNAYWVPFGRETIILWK